MYYLINLNIESITLLVEQMIITYKTKIMSLLTSEIEFVIFSNVIDLPPVVTPNGGIYS